jgi:biopolymer transport protein ExbD
MATALLPAEPAPMFDMNTTPLIDVLLVLLVMFIITIPIQTHAVKLDLPTCNACPKVDALKNEIAVTRGDAILWNRQPVSRGELMVLLDRSQHMRPMPEVHLRPDATARYEVVDEVLAITKQARIKQMGFAGNEAYLNTF